MAKKPKLLFVYDIEDEDYWKDGLWAAIELLKKDFEIFTYNLADNKSPKTPDGPPFPDSDWNTDFTLGWGAFGSHVDKWLQHHPFRKGLCLAGYAPYQGQKYNILFYEVENWSKEWLRQQGYQGKITHAFGVNTDIFQELGIGYDETYPKIFDYLTVGSFAAWKRQELICAKFGTKMAIGQIQKNNMGESINIIGNLLLGYCGVSDEVLPEKLVEFYNAERTVFIPADINGGGERAVLEARACGVEAEIMDDNPKLKELLTSPIWDQKYYKKKLKEGILSVL